MRITSFLLTKESDKRGMIRSKRVNARKPSEENEKATHVITIGQQTVMTNHIRSNTRNNQKQRPQKNYAAGATHGPTNGGERLKACLDEYMNNQASIEEEKLLHKFTIASLQQEKEDEELQPAVAKKLAAEEIQRHKKLMAKLKVNSSMRYMTKKWGVPRSTISDHVKARREGKQVKAGSGANHKWSDAEAYQLYKHLRYLITLRGSISIKEFEETALATWQVFRSKEQEQDQEGGEQPQDIAFKASKQWMINFCINFGFKFVGASKRKTIGYHRRTSVSPEVVESFAETDHREKEAWLQEVAEYFGFPTVLHMKEDIHAKEVIDAGVLTQDETVVGNQSPLIRTQVQQHQSKIPQKTGSQSTVLATVNEVFSAGLGQFYTEVFTKKNIDPPVRSEMKRLFGIAMRQEDEVTDEEGALRDDVIDEDEENFIRFHVIESGSYNGQSHGDMVAHLRTVWGRRWGAKEINGKRVADMPLLLTTDGPPSHLTEYVKNSADRSNIKIIILPSYSSWWLQVADDRPFCHCKQEYYQMLKDRRERDRERAPNMSMMLLMYFQARRKRLSVDLIQSAYQKTGQWPSSRYTMKAKATAARRQISGDESWEDQDDERARQLENLLRRAKRLHEQILVLAEQNIKRAELQIQLRASLQEREEVMKVAAKARKLAAEESLISNHYNRAKKDLAKLAVADEEFNREVLEKYSFDKILVEKEEIRKACADRLLDVVDVTDIILQMEQFNRLVTASANQLKLRDKKNGYVLNQETEPDALSRVVGPAVKNWKAVKKEMEAAEAHAKRTEAQFQKIQATGSKILQHHSDILGGLAALQQETQYGKSKNIWNKIAKAYRDAKGAFKILDRQTDEAMIEEGFDVHRKAAAEFEKLKEPYRTATIIWRQRQQARDDEKQKKADDVAQRKKAAERNTAKREKIKKARIEAANKFTARQNRDKASRRARHRQQNRARTQPAVDDDQPDTIVARCYVCNEHVERQKPIRLTKRFQADYCPGFCHTVCRKRRCSGLFQQLQQMHCSPQQDLV